MSLFTVTQQGVLTVDSSEILQELQDAYKGALGADLSLEESTPQGQMITNDERFLSYAQEQISLLMNNISPLTATGDALDVAGGIWGYYRKQDTATVVNVTLNGTAQTQVPAGTLFSNGDKQFSLLDTVRIGSSGFTIGQCACTETGAITCIAGSLNRIITPIEGLDSVNNPADGIVGFDRESDALFRKRITANWLNIRGISVLGSIIDAIAQVDGVISVVGRENYLDQTRIVDGVSMGPHSIYIDVLGGTGSDIAKVLTQKKTLGAATVGSVEAIYSDPDVNYPYSYNIARPAEVNIHCQIKYSENFYTPADVVDKIKDRVMAYIAENPFMIGEKISGYEISQALDGFEYAEILSVKVSLINGDFTDYIETNIQQVGVLQRANINVEVG